MRPIPAPRLGDTHGLLRAINQRERLRLDEFITEFSIEELFPPGLENALGRTRQFVSFARSAGLLNEDRGSVELTEIGKRYVRAGDEAAVFDVAPDQAEWLRRQLRERHMTDSIYHGAAIGLSLYASCPPDFRVSLLDFGRALAYLGRAGWDNENTLESQGERYTNSCATSSSSTSGPADLDRHGGQGRADAADPHVAARPRGPAQPRRSRGGRERGRGRMGRPRAQQPATAEEPTPAEQPRRRPRRRPTRRGRRARGRRPADAAPSASPVEPRRAPPNLRPRRRRAGRACAAGHARAAVRPPRAAT